MPHLTPIALRFRDTDGMAHVNNAVYLTYLEFARMDFFIKKLGFKSVNDFSFILAHVEFDFIKPITLIDHPIVKIWVVSIGQTSWVFEYRIEEESNPNMIYAKAKSVQLVYDYENNIKMKISDQLRKKLEENIETH
ncbi:MAG: acyl-CoA thioesterase [Candidatus Thorarchaeota archaeon]